MSFRSNRKVAAAAAEALPALPRSSPEPLYEQLARQLAQQIDGGVLAPGIRLGSERELMVRYGVSRVTVRQATALLRQQGRLVARPSLICRFGCSAFIFLTVVRLRSARGACPHRLEISTGERSSR